jgi:ATP synthase protein I
MAGPTPPQRESWIGGLRGVGLLSTVGISLVLCSMMGFGAGYWVDKKLHSSPWGTIIGFLIGVVAGFVEMFNILRKVNDDD